jgi:hypothetical protein
MHRCVVPHGIALKNYDGTVSQTKASACTQTTRSVCAAWCLRDASAATYGDAACKSAGKRPVSAIPLSESPMRLSVGRAVLEEVLLLQQLAENCVGQIEQSQSSRLRGNSSPKGKADKR